MPAETLLESERTMASVCEAVIGACYLGHGFERTAEAVASAFAGRSTTRAGSGWTSSPSSRSGSHATGRP